MSTHGHALPLEGEGCERLEYRMLEGSCDSGEVMGYPDALAHEAQREEKPCVVVPDDAPFDTAGVSREREEEWETRGLTPYRLAAYCPHLKLIEGVWRRLDGFLMPRRFNVHLEIFGACRAACGRAGTRRRLRRRGGLLLDAHPAVGKDRREKDRRGRP